MQLEEFAEVSLIENVRHHVNELLINLDYPDDFRRDRLLVNITREIVESYV